MRWSSYARPSAALNFRRTVCALIVIPRSRSMSILSRNCARISRSERAPVISRMRSASVDLPWSMCAMIEKLRMKERAVGILNRGPPGPSASCLRCASARCMLDGRFASSGAIASVRALRGQLSVERGLWHGRVRCEGQLPGQQVTVLAQDEINPFADVDRNGDLRPLVEEPEALVLLRRYVNRGRNLLAGHAARVRGGGRSPRRDVPYVNICALSRAAPHPAGRRWRAGRACSHAAQARIVPGL